MLYLLILPILSFLQLQTNEDRIIMYEGNEYKTTIHVEANFLGTYKGKKSGYLQLNADGTGIYKYDVFGLAPSSCERTPITFEWGFLLNEKGEVLKRERDYGYSYPILLKSTSKTTFQGCRTPVLMEYILDIDGVLNVSSSDDWKK